MLLNPNQRTAQSRLVISLRVESVMWFGFYVTNHQRLPHSLSIQYHRKCRNWLGCQRFTIYTRQPINESITGSFHSEKRRCWLLLLFALARGGELETVVGSTKYTFFSSTTSVALWTFCLLDEGEWATLLLTLLVALCRPQQSPTVTRSDKWWL